MKLLKIKIFIIKHLLSENQKCLLNQAINLQKIELKKSVMNNSDFMQDMNDLDELLEIAQNKLWN